MKKTGIYLVRILGFDPERYNAGIMIEVPRHIGHDNRGEVGSRLAAKVPFITKQSLLANVRYRPRPARRVSASPHKSRTYRGRPALDS